MDALMRISFRPESDATRGNTAEQYTRFRPMGAAISACRNSSYVRARWPAIEGGVGQTRSYSGPEVLGLYLKRPPERRVGIRDAV